MTDIKCLPYLRGVHDYTRTRSFFLRKQILSQSHTSISRKVGENRRVSRPIRTLHFPTPALMYQRRCPPALPAGKCLCSAEHQAGEPVSISRTHANFSNFIAISWLLMLHNHGWYQNVGNWAGNTIQSTFKHNMSTGRHASYYNRWKRTKNLNFDIINCSFEQEIFVGSVWN